MKRRTRFFSAWSICASNTSLRHGKGLGCAGERRLRFGAGLGGAGWWHYIPLQLFDHILDRLFEVD